MVNESLTKFLGTKSGVRSSLYENPRPTPSLSFCLPPDGSSRQLLAQSLIEQRRIGLALRRLHDLADEEAEQLLLAAAILGDLVRLRRHDRGDRRVDGAGIGHLAQSPLLDDL